MIDSKKFVFSKAAIARVLNIAVNLVVRVEKWWRVVLVIIKGQRPRFFKISTFTNHFVDYRKQEAEKLEVSQLPNEKYTGLHRYNVYNSEKKSQHEVTCYLDYLECKCEDYANQKRILKVKEVTCKHGYAVLKLLGFDRLSEYIDEHLWVQNQEPEPEIDEDEYRYYTTGYLPHH